MLEPAFQIGKVATEAEYEMSYVQHNVNKT